MAVGDTYRALHQRSLRDPEGFWAEHAARLDWSGSPPRSATFHRGSSERAQLDGLYDGILCACCSGFYPPYWWNPEKYIGPAGLLQAYHFIADTRDAAINERLDNLEDPYRLFRCHSIMNCVDVCPKGLNPTAAIGKIKELLVKRTI